MTAAHVFVDDVTAPAIAADDRHHLERVLRLRPGEAVTASDGMGGWIDCTFGPGGRLDPAGEVEYRARREPQLTVGFALVKAGRPEWIVQKLTECGIDRITPFVAARSVVRWDDAKAAQSVERWRRVAREAAMQSRRAWLPVVDGVTRLADAATGSVAGTALADATGDPPTLATPTILVGPEGGWTDAEREGRRCIRLGPQVMRAETASIAAGVLLAALRDGTVSPVPGDS